MLVNLSDSKLHIDKALIYILVLSVFLTTFSFEGLFYESFFYERILTKILGALGICLSLYLFFVASSHRFVVQSSYQVLFFVGFLYSALFLGEVGGGFLDEFFGVKNLLRMLLATSVCLITIFYFNDIRLNRFVYSLIVIISFFSIIYLFLDIGRGERIPGIEIYSRKSIVFEQNVYGMILYYGLLYGLFFRSLLNYKPNIIHVFIMMIIILGIFLSFYRTVWILSIVSIFIYGFIKSYKIRIFTIVCFFGLIALFLSNYEFFYEAFKLEQLKTLTGRTELWSVAYYSFFESPLTGQGEASIFPLTEYLGPRGFTSYHNLIVDVIAISGILGGMALFLLFLFFLMKIDFKYWVIFFLVWAPAMSNTFLPYSPNPLGLISGIFTLHLIYMSSKKYETYTDFKAA